MSDCKTLRRNFGGKRKTMKKLPKYAGTYHGVHKWYKSVFEKLG